MNIDLYGDNRKRNKNYIILSDLSLMICYFQLKVLDGK